ncbi:MAG: Crp/Fnr family transcriptional regulator [Rhodospirillaceae bacterium]|nr:Crp/Fnr family transcriptional regulator [Rhodospirillaceae bacterium]
MAVEDFSLGGKKSLGDLPCLFCRARSSSICSVLGNEEIKCLNDIVSRRSLAEGARLFEEGDNAVDYFVVTEGCLMVFKETYDGRRQITGFLYPGDMLGLNDRQHYVYTAEALQDSILCQYPISELNGLFRDFPDMEHWMLKHCSNELVSAHDQMFLLGRKNAAEKIATFLLLLLLRSQRQLSETDSLELPMSRRDIADYLGLTVETVSRTITRLRRDRIIETVGKDVIEILDIQALRVRACIGNDWAPAALTCQAPHHSEREKYAEKGKDRASEAEHVVGSARDHEQS